MSQPDMGLISCLIRFPGHIQTANFRVDTSRVNTALRFWTADPLASNECIALFASIDSIATRHYPRGTWSEDKASLGSGIGQLLEVSHADKVAGDQTAQTTVVWQNVPLQIG
jgi:hypothetical protein